MIVYMYAGTWLFTTTRRFWSNVGRRYGRAGGAGQNAGEATLSGPVVRHRSVSLTYSTSALTRQDFVTFNPTLPLVEC